MNFALVCLYYPLKNAMKYIRKLLNPLIPFLVLLLIVAKMSYDHFSKLEDYTVQENELLDANIKQIREIQKKYLHNHEYYEALFPSISGYCSINKRTRGKIDSLKIIYEIYSKYLQENREKFIMHKTTFGNTKYRIDGQIVELFENYISDMKALDNTLSIFFKGYKFNNAISATEVQRLYVCTNEQNLLYILNLFEAEMSKIYYDAVVELVYQKLYLSEADYIQKNAKVVPFLKTDSSLLNIESSIFFPLDSQEGKISSPDKLNYKLSEDNYFIVLKSYKNGDRIAFTRQINDCDTTVITRLNK
ncbi:hypothetical protein [Bernardetia sp. MNP-M8]|uniref:hypothetical protein n=1 Tax=Bernardetia sp. MNP-M8 TaxID=3127470 RepID=UPI0030D29744